MTLKEYGKLTQLIAGLNASDAAQSLDGVSIKDTIGHRAHWIGLFLGWYADGQAGKQVFFPAEGYKWSDLKRYNADLRQRQAGLDWEAAKALLEDQTQLLMEFIDSKSEADLYAAPMQGARNTWTPGRWAEAAGASHFRSAAKFIRSVMRAFPDDP
ncbi:ClbS/DfsB family four-helix bundle protein [Tateyamaria sp. SN3-11]|uniref:ClbS/DfsB family four-helix bundle protein n=1 Tax=Tateyamaria sp. SN3-11 TaxID=3092147 RepID=UPI0039E91BF5